MDFYDYIINRNAAQEKNPGKLSSYQQAAELICLCWNRLDMSFVMSQVFDSLQYSKRSYRADVDGSGDRSVAIITVDGEYQDMMHRLKIEDGLIKEIEVTPSGYWWSKQFGGSSPFGVVHQTSQHEQAAAVAAIENFVKTELGDKPITWATQYELRNSCCQLSFSCDGLSYDVLVEIHSFDDNKCRFVMYSEYKGLIAECKENDHIPCILALNEDQEFVSLTLLEDMDVRVQKLRNKGLNEWTFRGLFKTKAQLSRDIVEKKAESRWGSGFMKNLSRDLKEVNPDATCFSETNLLYMKNFYRLYQPYIAPQNVEQITQQVAEQMDNTITPQLGEQIRDDIFSIGWGHHKV